MSESVLEGMIGPNLEGIRVLSGNAEIVFVKYVKQILPLDGYVFWIRTEQLCVAGSLHVSTSKRQNEDETFSVNRVMFTTGKEVQQFNVIYPNVMWVGTSQGIKFAFSESVSRYEQAGLFHYVGDAVYPAMESQLVDVASQLSTDTLIVSNSLPAWLAIVSYAPVWLLVPNPGIPLYPSFAVPDNLRPVYGVVHIPPEGTETLAQAAIFDRYSGHSQLAVDRVRVTLYGATNDLAMAFFDTVQQYIEDGNGIGLMSLNPAVHDEKRTQAELGILAMKKTMEYRVSYTQAAVRNIARQLIEQAHVTLYPQSLGGIYIPPDTNYVYNPDGSALIGPDGLPVIAY